MPTYGRFKYNGTNYAAIPCYRTQNDYPSLNSSGAATSVSNSWIYYPAISTYTMELDMDINYKVCNLGSNYLNRNDSYQQTGWMNTEGRFRYYGTLYTALPCYSRPDNNYLTVSVNSNGMAISEYTNSWPYYPAISTYGINR